MKRYRIKAAAIGGFLSLALIAATPALGATSLSNSLTGFTGDSTLPATQAAVGAAGFSFFSTTGQDLENMLDPTVVFDATGATFGSLWGGDGGRNYMRTNDSDYATVPFVAEITLTVGAGSTPASSQQIFFGMGSGDTALFGVPDWSTLLASTFVSPEVSPEGVASLTTFRTQNDANVWVNNPVSGYGTGTHRVQMTFNPVAKTMTYALDLNYAGGAFSADFTAPAVDLNHIDCPVGCGFPEMPISADFFAPDGWPTEPSRIYWGGDDGVIYKDFSVTVSAPPAVLGDYNNNGIGRRRGLRSVAERWPAAERSRHAGHCQCGRLYRVASAFRQLARQRQRIGCGERHSGADVHWHSARDDRLFNRHESRAGCQNAIGERLPLNRTFGNETARELLVLKAR